MSVKDDLPQLVSLGRVRFDTETYNYGSRVAVAVSVIDPATGETLLRHAVDTARDEVIEPPEYGPEERVYVEEGTDDDAYDDYDLRFDGARAYYLHRPLIKPGKYRHRPMLGIEAEGRKKLVEWLESMKRVGELLTP